MFRATDDCDTVGISGTCQEKVQTKAKNIEKLGEYATAIGDNLQELANVTDGIFFRVSKNFALLHEI